MSHNTPIDYVFIEGPDCSGKTTLYEMIHKASSYRWNIQDRSALSMLIHARYYGRETFSHVEQLKRELYNLNNQMIICLPEWPVIVDRFQRRGDPIQNITSLRKLYELFSEAAEEFQYYPNVTVIRKVIDDLVVEQLVNRFMFFENDSMFNLVNPAKQFLATTAANRLQEVIGLNFVHFDTGDFSDVNNLMLEFDKEKDYYNEIENNLLGKIHKENRGDNPYNRKEGIYSRRYIYTDDQCISLAHFLVRDDYLDVKYFIRSSNARDILKYDLNFLKHLSKQVYNYFKLDKHYCKIEVCINSCHIPMEGTSESIEEVIKKFN